MNKAWVALLFVLVVFTTSAFAVTVEQIPPQTGDTTGTISDPALVAQQANQRLITLENKIQSLPSKSDIDVLLATQLKLEEAYIEDRVNYLSIVIIFSCVFCVAGVASIYFLLKSKGRL